MNHKPKPPVNVFHGTDREAACQRAIQIHGYAFEMDLPDGPWNGFWSGPNLPAVPHTPILDATDPDSTEPV